MKCCRSQTCLQYFIICPLVTTLAGAKSCAYFQTEYSKNSTALPVNENSSLTVSFNLRSEYCLNNDHFFILISKFISERKIYETQCMIWQKGEECYVKAYKDVFCQCTTTVGLYNFTKTIVRSDNTLWKLSTLNISSTDLIIHFDVKCAYFQTEKQINSTLLLAKENTSFTVSFSLKSENCLNKNIFYIQISKFISEESTYEVQCIIRQKGKACSVIIYKDVFCQCTTTVGIYNFTKTIVRADNTLWRFATVNISSTDLIIQFNVIYPAKVTRLTLNDYTGIGPHIVQENQSVAIVCSWENGNPPTTIRLLHGTGNTLHSDNDSHGNFTFQIMNATCRDSGPYICGAEDLTGSLSATLFVNCSQPATIVLRIYVENITSGQAIISLLFPAQSPNITLCQLSKIHETIISSGTLLNIMNNSNLSNEHLTPFSKESKSIVCDTIHTNYTHRTIQEDNCYCNVTGLAPNLTLMLQLNISTMRIAGHWRLAVFTLGMEVYYDILLQSSFGPDLSTNLHYFLNSDLIAGITFMVVTISIVFIVTIIKLVFLNRQKHSAALKPRMNKCCGPFCGSPIIEYRENMMSNQPENSRELQAMNRQMNIDVQSRSRTIELENTEDINDGRELIIINDIYERSEVVIRHE